MWPTSRKMMPKQFVDFFGVGRSLLQQTYDRVSRIFSVENIYVSTFEDYRDLVLQQLPEVSAENVLLEPVQLSTAPAVFWASSVISMRDADARVMMTPTDQHILDQAQFEEQVRRGLEFVGDNDSFLALGVKPSFPNTAYGYIQIADEAGESLYRVKSFVEKPELEYARLFVDSGEFFWNTGLFLWKVPTMQRLIERVSPAVAQSAGSQDRMEELKRLKELYPANMSRSIDLMILERCEQVVVQECGFGWADVGCWPELYQVLPKDVDGNAVAGNSRVIFSGCRNNVVSLPDGKVAIIKDLNGYMVAQNDKVLVICPNDNPTSVRRLSDEALMKLGAEFL